MVRSLAVLLCALAIAIPTRRAALATSTPLLHRESTAHGIRLTVQVLGTSFPLNALVPVTTTVRNISHRTVWIVDPGPAFPGKSVPQVEVLDHGTVVYPPALGWYLPLPGPPPTVVPLRSGQHMHVSAYVILRAPRGARLCRCHADKGFLWAGSPGDNAATDSATHAG
jgi:hypothetical protein